jgi:hypothetical protein
MNFHHNAAVDGPDSPRRSKRAGVVASVLVALGLVGVVVGLAAAPVTASSPSASNPSWAPSSCLSSLVCIVPQAVRWQ